VGQKVDLIFFSRMMMISMREKLVLLVFWDAHDNRGCLGIVEQEGFITGRVSTVTVTTVAVTSGLTSTVLHPHPDHS